MMKKVIIWSLLLLLSPGSNYIYAYNESYINQQQNTIQEELYKGSLESLLYPYISNEIDRYYGHTMPFFGIKILSIKKTPYKPEYEITTQVVTYTGAHNPPHTKDTIIILTNLMGTKVINSKHEPL